MSIETVDDVVLKARTDLSTFAEHCFGFKNTWFHKKWYQTIQDYNVDSGLIIAPRNSAKSTCWGRVSPLWLLGRNPDLRIVSVSRTSSRAKDNLRFIKQNIESNDKIKKVFPYRKISGRVYGLRQSAPWGEEQLTVENNRLDGMPSIYAVGLEGSISGVRADIIIVDDLIDQNNVMTESQRSKVIDFWNAVIIPTLNPNGRIFLVGTRYHAKDFYSQIIEDPMYKDNFFWFPALKLDDDGELVLTDALDKNGNVILDNDKKPMKEPISYWPDYWPVQRLLLMKERMGSLAFNSQYMCNISGYAGQLFDPEDIQFYNPEMLKSIWGNLDFIMSVDPNVTEDPESDNTAIVTAAIDRKNSRVYVMDIFAKPLGFVNQVKMLKRYGSKTQLSVGNHKFTPEAKISKIGVESVGYQRSLQTTGYLMGLPVVEVKQGNIKKEVRILRLQPHIENGRVMFPSPDIKGLTVPWWERFLEEYCTFPKGRRDDMMDALEILVTMVSGSLGISGIPWGPGGDYVADRHRWEQPGRLRAERAGLVH